MVSALDQPADRPRDALPWLRRMVRAWLPPALIATVTLAAYASTFSVPFLFDDHKCIVENPFAQRFTSLREALSDVRLGLSRPLVLWSVQLNYAWGRFDVRGYHAVNLAIHILAALTLYGIVRRTLLARRTVTVDETTASLLGLATALIWAVHPLATQGVTYIIQRAESLMGLLYLLVFYLVVRGATSAWAIARGAWYALAVAACSSGMMTKEVMVTAPVVVALFDRVFLSSSWVELARRRWPLYVGLFASWGVLALIMVGVWSNPQSEAITSERMTAARYAATQLGVVVHYLKLAIWPHPLCLDYTWPSARTIGAVLWPGLVIAVLVATVVWAWWRRRAVGFLGAAVFIILSPTSSVLSIQDAAFEHRMYLPLVPLVVLAVVGGYWLLEGAIARFHIEPAAALHVRWGAFSALVVLVGVLAVATYRRNADYTSDLSMWSDVVAKRPMNARARHNLGHALFQEGNLDAAAVQLREAIRLKRDFAQAYNELGAVLEKQGKHDEALEQFAEAIRRMPEMAIAHYNMGCFLAKTGNVTEAEAKFRDALALDPRLAIAHNELGILMARQGRLDEAAAAFRAALAVQANYAPACRNLANVMLAQGRSDEAARLFRQLLVMRPGDSGAVAGLGRILVQQKKLAEATEIFRDALRNHPESAELTYRLAAVLATQGKFRDAAPLYRRALSLRPRWPEAASELAWILATAEETELRSGLEAVALAKDACVQTQFASARALDALAAAHAEAGQLAEAVYVAELALTAARSTAGLEAVAAASRRLELYRQGQPFRDRQPLQHGGARFGEAIDHDSR